MNNNINLNYANSGSTLDFKNHTPPPNDNQGGSNNADTFTQEVSKNQIFNNNNNTLNQNSISLNPSKIARPKNSTKWIEGGMFISFQSDQKPKQEKIPKLNL